METLSSLQKNKRKTESDHLREIYEQQASQRGTGFGIHKMIGKLPIPKGGFTLPGYRYAGPYNPVEKQLKYDPNTGEILEIYQQPSGKTDAVAMPYDVDYSICKDDKGIANIKLTRRWSRHWMLFHGKRGSGVTQV